MTLLSYQMRIWYSFKKYENIFILAKVGTNKIKMTTYKRKDNILLADFEDGGVAFDMDDRRCLELNSSGAHILNQIDGEKDIVGIVDDLSEKFDHPKEKLKKDLEIFLENMKARGWLNVIQTE